MTSITTIYRFVLWGALLALLQSCASAPGPVALYDFGTLPETHSVPGCALAPNLPPIQLADITSPASLDSTLMQYRLLYDNDQQSHAYAGYRWSMTPAQLLGSRIRAQLQAMQVNVIDSGTTSPGHWQLRLDLSEFSQQFSDASHSVAQLQLRASVLRANTLIAQTTLSQHSAAAKPDAPSGAQAMRVAADTLITDLNNWLCKLPRP